MKMNWDSVPAEAKPMLRLTQLAWASFLAIVLLTQSDMGEVAILVAIGFAVAAETITDDWGRWKTNRYMFVGDFVQMIMFGWLVFSVMMLLIEGGIELQKWHAARKAATVPVTKQ